RCGHDRVRSSPAAAARRALHAVHAVDGLSAARRISRGDPSGSRGDGPIVTPVPAFAGQPLDRADHIRTDPARLAAARRGGLLLKLDERLPVLDDDDGLPWTDAGEAPADAELVFLGLLEDRAAFAEVPPRGDSGPAYAHRPAWAEVSRLSAPELAIYGEARTMLDWHARHRFCAQCGETTRPAKGGWQRDCPACAAQHFPRVDPVAIMLVECEG